MLLLFASGAIAFSVRNAMPVSAKAIESESGWNKTDTVKTVLHLLTLTFEIYKYSGLL
jgi:hypothetical protein